MQFSQKQEIVGERSSREITISLIELTDYYLQFFKFVFVGMRILEPLNIKGLC